MEHRNTEVRTELKDGYLTKSPRLGKRHSFKKWRERYFVFCKIESGENQWLHLHYYTDYAAYKAKRVPKDYIDISNASAIGMIDKKEIAGHRHILRIDVPGRIHYLSASSCEDLFQWNFVLRSNKFNDESLIYSQEFGQLSSSHYARSNGRLYTDSVVEAIHKRDRSQKSRGRNRLWTTPFQPSDFRFRMKFMYCEDCRRELERLNSHYATDPLQPQKSVPIEPIYDQIDNVIANYKKHKENQQAKKEDDGSPEDDKEEGRRRRPAEPIEHVSDSISEQDAYSRLPQGAVSDMDYSYARAVDLTQSVTNVNMDNGIITSDNRPVPKIMNKTVSVPNLVHLNNATRNQLSGWTSYVDMHVRGLQQQLFNNSFPPRNDMERVLSGLLESPVDEYVQCDAQQYQRQRMLYQNNDLVITTI